MLKEALELGARFEVRPNDPRLKLSALSGGNAQKVLVARWMNRKPALLLLDEPTQGVDVGTRQQIFVGARRPPPQRACGDLREFRRRATRRNLRPRARFRQGRDLAPN